MLESLELERIRIPFRVAFKHASAERSETESVWVEARSTRGRVGHGEGCPRSYVTGEDLTSTIAFFTRHRPSLLREVEDLATLRRWMARREAELDRSPAAWCAVELALLEVLARERGRSVEALLGIPELDGDFRYTAVLGDMGIDAFRGLFEQYRAFGFTDYKLKLSGELAHDREKLAVVRDAGAEIRVRLDANNLFGSVQVAERHLRALGGPFFAIEEPLGPDRYPDLAALADALGTRVILDESLLRAEQLDRLPGAPGRWIVNLRISKMGGLLRSLDVAEAARERGIDLVIGAQVGETSLLTRAALTVAMRARARLLAQEGAFGTLLLERDVCDPPLVFGRGGVLHADAVPRSGDGFGLPLAPDRSFLEHVDASAIPRDSVGP